MNYIAGRDRGEALLLPDVLDDYITAENPVRFSDAFAGQLDLSKAGFTNAQLNETGRPPYDPGDLLRLYLYGYLNRVRSSRGLEREATRNLELIWLLRKLRPDFKTIADFRRDNGKAIKAVCREFILLCRKLELFGGELVAIDSTKIKAQNSKGRNYSQGKLKALLAKIENKVSVPGRVGPKRCPGGSKPHRSRAAQRARDQSEDRAAKRAQKGAAKPGPGS